MSDEVIETPQAEQRQIDPSTIATNKVAACAVSLGVAILQQLVGRDISGVATENANELMATTINNELKL